MVQILSAETRNSEKLSLIGMRVRSMSSSCKEISSGCLIHHQGPISVVCGTVRKILVALIREQPLDDEGLATLMF